MMIRTSQPPLLSPSAMPLYSICCHVYRATHRCTAAPYRPRPQRRPHAPPLHMLPCAPHGPPPTAPPASTGAPATVLCTARAFSPRRQERKQHLPWRSLRNVLGNATLKRSSLYICSRTSEDIDGIVHLISFNEMSLGEGGIQGAL